MHLSEPQNQPQEMEYSDEPRRAKVQLVTAVAPRYGAARPALDPLHPGPRPARLLLGLALGALIGVAVGLALRVLLFQSITDLARAEPVFSVGPFAFHLFWVLGGLDAGFLLGGITATLARWRG
jgi:hypothetical protein